MAKKSLRKRSSRKKSLRKKSLRKKSLRKKSLRKKSLRKKSLRKKSLRKKSLRKKSNRRSRFSFKSKRKCPKGKVLNPKTGRCVSKSGKIGKTLKDNSQEKKSKSKSQEKKSKSKSQEKKSKRKCPEGKIENPKTGRCVSKSGKIGKTLKDNSHEKKSKSKSQEKSKSKSQKKKSKRKCPEGKIENPKTGRCVSKSGKIGKTLNEKSNSKSQEKKSAKKSVKKSTKKSVKKSTKKSVKKSTKKSVKKSTKVPGYVIINTYRYYVGPTVLYNNNMMPIAARQLPLLGELKNLTDLTLNNVDLGGKSTAFLANLTNLTRLSLVNARLDSIPPEVLTLTRLTYLNLAQNKIKTIADDIDNLQNLTILDLFKNQIETLPDSIGNLVNLKRLYAEDNKLTFIPDTIGNLRNLEWLYLSKNLLIIIPHEVGNLTNLKNLYIDDNKLEGIPRMPNLVNVVEFNVVNNDFDSDMDLVGKTKEQIFEIIFGRPPGDIVEVFFGPEISPEYQSPYKIYMSPAFVKQTQYKPLPLDNDDLRIVLAEMPKPHIVYACPAGHLHSAGNCGIPTEVVACGWAGCDKLVGGLLHMLVPGSYVVYHDRYQFAKVWYGNFPIFSYDQYKRIRKQANVAKLQMIPPEPELALLHPVADTNIARKIVDADIVAEDVNADCGICGDAINRNDANAYILPACGHLMCKDCVEGARGGNLEWINDKDGVAIPDEDLRARKCPVCNINFKFGRKARKEIKSKK